MTGQPAPDRGPTYTEQHRHECEVRYVLGLGKAGRDRYFYGDATHKPLAAVRGEAAAQQLIDDARATFLARRAARRGEATPTPRCGDEGGAQAARSPATSSHPVGGSHRGDGSFPPLPIEGNSNPDRCVDSGGLA